MRENNTVKVYYSDPMDQCCHISPRASVIMIIITRMTGRYDDHKAHYDNDSEDNEEDEHELSEAILPTQNIWGFVNTQLANVWPNI